MKCPKCGTANEAGSAFCARCGGPLAKGSESTPAQQAAQLSSKFQNMLKNLTIAEKILAIGIIANFVSFFLPWIGLNKTMAQAWKASDSVSGMKIGGWAYLLPLAMLVCLGLLYFSMGAKAKNKAQSSTYQAVIGAVFFTLTVVLYILLSKVENFLATALPGLTNQNQQIFSVGFGWWLLLIGSIVMIAGALLVQKENLKNL